MFIHENSSLSRIPMPVVNDMDSSSTMDDENPQRIGYFPSHLFDKLDQLVFDYLVTTYAAAFEQSPQWFCFWKFMIMSDKAKKPSDFTRLRVLGKGGFGLVVASKHQYTGHLFAMKIIDKSRAKIKKSINSCMSEQKILTLVSSPFIVCLKYSFSTSRELYLVMDLMLGGDLRLVTFFSC